MKKVTHEEMVSRLYNLVGDEYTLVSNFERGTIKVDLLHKKCGEVYSVTTNKFVHRGDRCKCQRNRKTPEQYKKEFDKVSKGEYTQHTEYVKGKSRIEVTHNSCGRRYLVLADEFIAGARCIVCYGNPRKTTDEFREEVRNLTNGKYILKGEYVNNRTKVTLIHNTSNPHEYKVSPKDFLRGTRCPLCKMSNGEETVAEVLDSLGESYVYEKVYDELRSSGHAMPFDFYLPKYEALIEYDGEQHYKSIEYFGGDSKLRSQQRRDAMKNNYAKDNSISILRIPYTYSREDIKHEILEFLKEVTQGVSYKILTP